MTAWYTAVALGGGLLLMAGSFAIALHHIDEVTVEVDSLAQRIFDRNPKGDRFATLPTRAELERLEAARRADRAARATAEQQVHVRTRNSLLLELSALLAGFALLAVAIGLFVSRRVLTPVKRITATARTVGSASLGARLRLGGPEDELKELADTFDTMLDRVERGFVREREFVANASHELRTPLAIIRAEIDAALSSPGPIQPDTARSFEAIESATSRSEQLITSLLSLSRANEGLRHCEPVNLRTVAEEVLSGQQASIAAADIALCRSLADAWISGDEMLLRQLVANLVDNAVRYNRPRGTLSVATEAVDGSATLALENDGPRLVSAEVDRLLEPFQRGAATDRAPGLGLGLAIVESIAHAHEGTVALTVREQGGLLVRVRFSTDPCVGNGAPDR
jgi:signal transduction histidine kinase